MSRYDCIVQGGLAAALLLYGITSTAPAYAAPADALMPIEKYTRMWGVVSECIRAEIARRPTN